MKDTRSDPIPRARTTAKKQSGDDDEDDADDAIGSRVDDVDDVDQRVDDDW
jgi:hypothetical protein